MLGDRELYWLPHARYSLPAARYFFPSNRERLFEQCREFKFVQGQRADGRRGGGVATGVERLASEELFELRRDPRPGAHVLGFLLRPDEFRAPVFFRDLGQTFPMQWIELLDSHDCGVGLLLFGAVV